MFTRTFICFCKYDRYVDKRPLCLSKWSNGCFQGIFAGVITYIWLWSALIKSKVQLYQKPVSNTSITIFRISHSKTLVLCSMTCKLAPLRATYVGVHWEVMSPSAGFGFRLWSENKFKSVLSTSRSIFSEIPPLKGTTYGLWRRWQSLQGRIVTRHESLGQQQLVTIVWNRTV